MSNTKLRIHPAIGIARVGSSPEYYIAPETSAGLPIAGQSVTGGLPIKPGTEDTTITSNDLRDGQGRLKRQAARFRIYQYSDNVGSGYPTGSGTEVVIGSLVDGKRVKDIVWTVHLANKKANCWKLESDPAGLDAYKDGNRPPLRNKDFAGTSDPSNKTRLRQLVIDAGPRAIKASDGRSIAFDNTTPAYDGSTGEIVKVSRYPQSFPASDGAGPSEGSISHPITTLGEMTTETNGRLIVLGAYGLACGFDSQGKANPDAPVIHDVDNDNWLDDTADGPVRAVLIFDDNSPRPVDSSAWVVSTDPSYAPQTRNVVSVWDEVSTTWIEKFGLRPDIYSNGLYQSNFRPSFNEDIFPILRAASMQRWNTNLPDDAIRSHDNIEKLPVDPRQYIDIMPYIRNPDSHSPELSTGSPLMPLALGDNQKSFLTLTTAQYFFVKQWSNGECIPSNSVPLGPGEALDKSVLSNCLGGRFGPGIELTFIVRDPHFYKPNWQDPGVGPFRINMRNLDYRTATANEPFLGVGYIPSGSDPVEPGDLCKFMAIPWHTDYNSCATHLPDPNPGGELNPDGSNLYSGVNTTLYWSWPAQRPVAVYTYEDLVANDGTLPVQRYSVRGEGTDARQLHEPPVQLPPPKEYNSPAMNVGRYQDRRGILLDWDKIGFVIQGVAIDGYPKGYPQDYYLEVQSLFKKDYSNLVQPWPNYVTDSLSPPND
ncbi:hypothetical protein WL40_06065 [Burkholderia ubonensis]|uniref:LodA/GoxA family CTQ-dependent oxidase n=1 Tax=Burkholderia ubonensis TaxID=101571 RepID=UPI000758A8D6|nr:LodA/GoxA family CTQ-dependent oxidase [Burkholderia ubonensis]KWB76837.1 hypothetical protein WL40_06065 [Burkholderia ubonensis]